MSAETDSIARSITGLELQIDDLDTQKKQVEKYLEELTTARNAISSERSSFFEKLHDRRSVVASMGEVANASVAKTISSHMQEAFGASFESGVDAGFTGLAGDVEANMQAARDKIDELSGQISAAQNNLDAARSDLRTQMAKEEAERAAGKDA